ncbi:MAG TPA: Cof-type HAD-IIB family hydrolase [Candidatus Limnocylindrales bacterium]|nr:Cof-type HAD-IIB family hydrolase [Candidatus Limnocylindrales bacterium]
MSRAPRADVAGARTDVAGARTDAGQAPDEPIRLVVSDLDGTLLRGDLTVSPRVRQAIDATQARGVSVLVASGRMYRSIVPWAQELGLGGPVIAYQGAYVRELPGRTTGPQPPQAAGALLRHRPLDAAVAREAVAWCLGRGLDPHANIDDQLVMSEDDRNAADYERSSGIEARFVPDLMAELERWPTKILAAGASGRPEALLDEVRATFRGRAQVTVSHPEYLEFTAPGVTKGQALRWVARRLRVPIRQVLAIGDQYNDLEMLAAAGHGVAMGQSPLRVRAAARYVTGSIDEDGAARALEALVLGQAELPEGVA